MQIAGNEVKVVSKDKVKVGCAEVTRAEVEGVLKMMNEAKAGITLKELAPYTLSISIGKVFHGDIFVKVSDGVSDYLVSRTDSKGRWSHSGCGRLEYDVYDDVRVRPLTPDEVTEFSAKMLAASGER